MERARRLWIQGPTIPAKMLSKEYFTYYIILGNLLGSIIQAGARPLAAPRALGGSSVWRTVPRAHTRHSHLAATVRPLPTLCPALQSRWTSCGRCVRSW